MLAHERLVLIALEDDAVLDSARLLRHQRLASRYVVEVASRALHDNGVVHLERRVGVGAFLARLLHLLVRLIQHGLCLRGLS